MSEQDPERRESGGPGSGRVEGGRGPDRGARSGGGDDRSAARHTARGADRTAGRGDRGAGRGDDRRAGRGGDGGAAREPGRGAADRRSGSGRPDRGGAPGGSDRRGGDDRSRERGRDGGRDAGRGGSGWNDRGGARGGSDRRGGRADGDSRPSRGDDRGPDRFGRGRPGSGGPRSSSGDDRRHRDAGPDRRDRPSGDRPSHDRSGGDVARGRGRPDDRGRSRPDDRGPRRSERDAGRPDRGDRGAPTDRGARGSREDRGNRGGGRTGPGPRNAGPPRGRVGPGRPPSVDPARQAAYDLLTAVRERDAYANLALPSILRRYRLRDRDAALATELGYGTLRAQGLLDAVIDACTDRPLSKIEHPLLDALRLGAYQLLRTRVPPHAAVDTCVELVRGEAGSRSAGFVNAVLRRIGENDEATWMDRLAPDAAEDPVGSAALRHAHPVWIARAFADALGSTGEELTAALAADDTRPVVHLLARPGDISAEELALTTGGEPAPYSPYGVHLEAGSGDVGELEPVAEGMALVQDEGSQLAALALTRAELVGPDGGRWLDLCAGPGGKAALLGGLAQLSGATLDAVEVTEHRAELVRSAVAELPVTVHTADGRSAPLPDDTFDRVLVDAPCTGLGALRRRPEARWRRGPEDITDLATLQRELLLAGLRHVRPGGVVAYVTCSPHLSETVGVLARALRRGTPLAEVERLDARAAMPEGTPALGEGPTVQLWPHRHGTDAMFIALLRRPTES